MRLFSAFKRLFPILLFIYFPCTRVFPLQGVTDLPSVRVVAPCLVPPVQVLGFHTGAGPGQVLSHLLVHSPARYLLPLEGSSWRQTTELSSKILKQGLETRGSFTQMKNKEKTPYLRITARLQSPYSVYIRRNTEFYIALVKVEIKCPFSVTETHNFVFLNNAHSYHSFLVASPHLVLLWKSYNVHFSYILLICQYGCTYIPVCMLMCTTSGETE